MKKSTAYLLLAAAVSFVVSFTVCSIGRAAEYTDQPYLAQIGVTPELHAQFNGAGVKIANIDGYPNWVPDVWGNTAVVNIWNLPQTPTRWSTEHSTRTISLMNGIKNDWGVVGVAPRAYMYDFPVWNANDSAFVASYAWPTIFNYAYYYGARIINVEITQAAWINNAWHLEAIFAPGDLNRISQYRSQLLFVYGAGNQGTTITNQWLTYRASTYLQNLIIVGSVDANNQHSTFSNVFGERCFFMTGDQVCQENEKLKHWGMVAPGERMMMANATRGYDDYWSGTSFSQALVSGAAALVQGAAGVPLSPADVRAILFASATDLGDPGDDAVYGHGLLNVAAALAPIGLQSLPVVPGQIVYDRFGRPFKLDPVPVSLAPSLASWSVMMGGVQFASASVGAYSFTTRQALAEHSMMTMVGLERSFGELEVGLNIGALHEDFALFGNRSFEPTTTRLVGAQASWRSVSGFYIRGDNAGYVASSYGLEIARGAYKLSIVKPMSIDGYGAVPIATTISWKAVF